MLEPKSGSWFESREGQVGLSRTKNDVDWVKHSDENIWWTSERNVTHSLEFKSLPFSWQAHLAVVYKEAL